ncbi:MAG: hypothetical protein AB1798_07650 [Spirochaetota bacterium]
MILLLSSCNGGVDSFSFQLPAGKTVKLAEKPGRAAGAEGLLLPAKAGMRRSPLYLLKSGVEIAENGKAFSLIYQSSITSLFLRVFSTGKKEIAAATLPVSSDNVVDFRLPLKRGLSIGGFLIETESNLGDARILGAGISPYYAGINMIGNYTILGSGMLHTKGGKHGSSLEEFSFSRILRENLVNGSGTGILLEYSYWPPDNNYYITNNPLNGVVLKCSFGKDEKSLKLKLHPGVHKVYLYSEICLFQPDSLSVESDTSGFSIQTIEIIGQDRDKPIPADFGTILMYPPSVWRKKEYELFSWNLYPSILVFDTADYSIQSLFFTRLAFFVEKKGFTGTLLPDTRLKEQHGWNAHDYSAESLSAFFQAALEQKFTLNAAEEELKTILLKNRIIYEQKGRFLPGRGGVLSISRESPAVLRKRFITHEGFHGLFFSSPEYRNECFRIWNNLPKQEQDFWKMFFNRLAYDTDNTYLIVNEFQAYLLQQPLKDTENYFRNHAVFHGLLSKDDKGGVLKAFFFEKPHYFESTAREMAISAFKNAGVWAGDLECLTDTNRSFGEARP